MSKSFLQNAENSSIFLVTTETDDNLKKGERADTSPLRTARLIEINRIKPDPNQPRKTFIPETLESLAESIKELDGIIDPLTVEYDDQKDFFRIISGERRYRASKMIGLEKLPCIIKEVGDQKRFLMQFVANLQREDIPPLEEAAGIKYLVENYGYSQVKVAKLLNRSKSYVSQILGLERLSQPAREIVQTAQLPKEVQIRASREKDPEKQQAILKKASEEGKTVRQIRRDQKKAGYSSADNMSDIPKSDEKLDKTVSNINKFREWSWKPDDGRFDLTVRFREDQIESQKNCVIRTSLEEALKHIGDLLSQEPVEAV